MWKLDKHPGTDWSFVKYVITLLSSSFLKTNPPRQKCYQTESNCFRLVLHPNWLLVEVKNYFCGTTKNIDSKYINRI